jgi:hypothetical protein
MQPRLESSFLLCKEKYFNFNYNFVPYKEFQNLTRGKIKGINYRQDHTQRIINIYLDLLT